MTPDIQQYYGIYDLESGRFIKYGKKLSTDNLLTYWLDDIDGVCFSEDELNIIEIFINDGTRPDGFVMCLILDFIEQNCVASNLIGFPCDQDMNNKDYINSFPLKGK